SSSVTWARRPAAERATAAPVASEPVNVTWSTPGWATSHSPASRAPPIVLNTPGGKPARANSSANFITDTGACSEGLTTIVQPAASAGASFQVSSRSGEFHGTIAPTTPTGSRVTNPKKSARPVSTTRPSILSAAPAKYRYHDGRARI